jgi:hypothetical protein
MASFPTRIIFLVLILMLGSSGIVCATVNPQQPDEVQDLRIETSVISSGTFKQDSSLDWALSSEYLGVNGIIVGPGEFEFQPEPPLNPAGEVQMHCIYTEHTTATKGNISFDKVGTVDTRAKAGGDWNVENLRQITFTGHDAGSVLSKEDLSLTGVGTSIPLSFSKLCPFECGCAGGCDCIPMFCNSIAAGSSIDLDTFGLASSANLRNINQKGDPGFYPPIPTSDEPARLFFQTEVTGYTSSLPADGLISTYLDTKSKEGGPQWPGLPLVNQDVSVQEKREIIGKTSLFSYTVDYESGIGVEA